MAIGGSQDGFAATKESCTNPLYGVFGVLDDIINSTDNRSAHAGGRQGDIEQSTVALLQPEYDKGDEYVAKNNTRLFAESG